MGIEKTLFTARLKLENRAFLFGACTNFGVRITASSLADAIFDYVRNGIAAGDINLIHDILQGTHCIHIVRNRVRRQNWPDP